MRILITAILAACASSAQAQFNQTYTTCGANNVTQMEAGALWLPNDDIVVEVDTTSQPYLYSNIGVVPVTPGLDLFMAICDTPPGPVMECPRQYDYSGVNAPEFQVAIGRGHYYILVEGTRGSGATASCGDFQLTQALPLD